MGGAESSTFDITDTISSFHVKQRHNHDCGLACIEMVILWAEEKLRSAASSSDLIVNTSNSHLLRDDTNTNSGHPYWSIDLIDIIKTDFSNLVDASLHTNCKGVGAHHHEISWYSNHLSDDLLRVEPLFEKAEANRWKVIEVHNFSFQIVVLNEVSNITYNLMLA